MSYTSERGDTPTVMTDTLLQICDTVSESETTIGVEKAVSEEIVELCPATVLFSHTDFQGNNRKNINVNTLSENEYGSLVTGSILKNLDEGSFCAIIPSGERVVDYKLSEELGIHRNVGEKDSTIISYECDPEQIEQLLAQLRQQEDRIARAQERSSVLWQFSLRESAVIAGGTPLSSIRREFGGRVETYISHLYLIQRLVLTTTPHIEKSELNEIRADVYERVFRHNIRNRMTTIQLATDYIERNISAGDTFETEAVIEQCESITRAADRLSRAAENITKSKLVLSDSESVELNIEEIVRDVLQSLSEPYSFDLEIDTIGDGVVEAHPQLRIAVEEIIENAIIHGGDTISITISQKGNSVTATTEYALTIHDNGDGIPQFEIDAIEASKETPLNHMSGTGLWLVDLILSQSGARWEIERKNGTKVTIYLQAVQGE